MKLFGYADTNSWMKVMGFMLALFSSTSAYAVDEINTTYFGNLAIKGYDPVAYFTENRPVEGDKKCVVLQFEPECFGFRERYQTLC